MKIDVGKKKTKNLTTKWSQSSTNKSILHLVKIDKVKEVYSPNPANVFRVLYDKKKLFGRSNLQSDNWNKL